MKVADIDVTVTNQIVRSVLMMYAQTANVKIPMEHYISKLKEHEAKRLSTNERNAYWKEYLL